ncbi:barstar family protein [Cedecea neteri]|uniref:barstar family protein n=1 Tax=Cedecea neteri TaxID=158822 RepID=UPI002AA8009A|nr:barstar family protein [Cedecea neteri]WPU24808.1 barstar family protein [Cedecea neteri]
MIFNEEYPENNTNPQQLTDSNEIFKFINGPASYDTAEVFFARLDPLIASTDELLKSIYYLLWFPGYFGFNWNALADCLSDFSWIGEEKIIIAHDNLPDIPGDDLKVYIEVLRDAVASWVNDERHILEVIFQEKDRGCIKRILFS